MPKRILVVCVGNICRSPMAEALLAAGLGPEFHLSSAGIGAVVGEPAHPTSVALMEERGLDISHHRGRQMDETLLQESDLVLPMEQAHIRWIEERWPHSRGRVYRLGHWDDTDIPDPYRRDDAVFRQVLTMIDNGVSQWCEKLLKL